jgi:hypothetical protein
MNNLHLQHAALDDDDDDDFISTIWSANDVDDSIGVLMNVIAASGRK